MTYEEKKVIADSYLGDIAGVSWDDLPDINSLHDAETKDDVIELCDVRLKEDFFPFDTLVEE
jgi:hypothetical protein